MTEPVIKKNSKIICPNCSADIGHVINDLFEGDSVLETDIRLLTPPISMQLGFDPICVNCGARWYLENSISLEGGWQPPPVYR